jgi:hypothetical protein
MILIKIKHVKMILSDREIAQLRKLLLEIDQGLEKTRYRQYIQTRTRLIRLMLSKAHRREKGTLL